MDAKMQSYFALLRSDAQASEQARAPRGDAGIHVDHVLAILAQVQQEAQALRSYVRSAQFDGAVLEGHAELSDALQQTLTQLRTIQDDIAAQQARLDAMPEGQDSNHTSNRATGPRARMADSVRSEQSETQVAKGLRAVTTLHAGPAAGSGLGDSHSGREADNVVQIPGGEREGLDGIVALVGGMLRQASGPTVVGKQSSAKAQAHNTAWQARPDSVPLAQLQDQWRHYVTTQAQTRKSPESMDINQLIQWVMREAYIGNTQDLRSHATRVEYYTQLKTQLREELNRAREFRSKHRTGAGDTSKLDASFDLNHISLDPDVTPEGQWAVRPMQPDGSTESLEELDAYIKKLDNSLSTVGDDGQAAQLDLQNLSQKQAQLMNMLSNLSKAMHDTAMSTIRKIGN